MVLEMYWLPEPGNDLLILYIIQYSNVEAALIGYRPNRRSKAAGFKSCNELSSFKGVRHFWQFMILEVLALLLRDRALIQKPK